eukprot:scaffold28117_cov56-Attheya_sp.AAC.9
MTEQRKAVIKNADMSEDMQQDAVDCASQALSKYNIEKPTARFVTNDIAVNYLQGTQGATVYRAVQRRCYDFNTSALLLFVY